MKSLLKSKKTWITLSGVVICVILAKLGADWQLIGAVAALFGIQLTGHIATDIITIIKGLQSKKEQ